MGALRRGRIAGLWSPALFCFPPPREPSLPRGLLQLPHVLMEAGVSMATLTSRAWSPGTLPPAPRAWFGSSPGPRGVGAAALPSLILTTRGTQV